MDFYARQTPGSYYPITGPSGGVHPRLEIRQLQQTGEMWNLFLLALQEFEAMDQTVIDSYYQIAGVFHEFSGSKFLNTHIN
jgi:tyrosinase